MSDIFAAIQTLVRNGEIRVSEKVMRKRLHSKLIHEGQYLADVDVELIETDESWSPYLSIEDAYRLDYVRDALRRGDISAATRQARVFSLTPVTC